jgi:hypothetical protein
MILKHMINAFLPILAYLVSEFIIACSNKIRPLGIMVETDQKAPHERFYGNQPAYLKAFKDGGVDTEKYGPTSKSKLAD